MRPRAGRHWSRDVPCPAGVRYLAGVRRPPDAGIPLRDRDPGSSWCIKTPPGPACHGKVVHGGVSRTRLPMLPPKSFTTFDDAEIMVSNLALNLSVFADKPPPSLHNDFLNITARTPRHPLPVDPMRRLPGFADDPEDVVGGEVEDRKPVEPFPAGAGVAVAARPGDAFGPCAALVAADSDGADDVPGELRVVLQVAAQFPFNR